MSDIYVGIDNGLTGGVAILSAYHGTVIAAFPMPKMVRNLRGKSKGKSRQSNEIDTQMLVKIIKPFSNREGEGFTFAVEECPEHARKKGAMRSMAMSYGAITGAIGVCFPYAKIAPVRSGNSADSWQRAMLGVVKDTKPVALAKVRERWPNERWLATPRSKVAHMGMVDAALIAEYGRLNNL